MRTPGPDGHRQVCNWDASHITWEMLVLGPTGRFALLWEANDEVSNELCMCIFNTCVDHVEF